MGGEVSTLPQAPKHAEPKAPPPRPPLKSQHPPLQAPNPRDKALSPAWIANGPADLASRRGGCGQLSNLAPPAKICVELLVVAAVSHPGEGRKERMCERLCLSVSWDVPLRTLWESQHVLIRPLLRPVWR